MARVANAATYKDKIGADDRYIIDYIFPQVNISVKEPRGQSPTTLHQLLKTHQTGRN